MYSATNPQRFATPKQSPVYRITGIRKIMFLKRDTGLVRKQLLVSVTLRHQIFICLNRKTLFMFELMASTLCKFCHKFGITKKSCSHFFTTRLQILRKISPKRTPNTYKNLEEPYRKFHKPNQSLDTLNMLNIFTLSAANQFSTLRGHS